MTNEEMLQKADIQVSDLTTDGGALTEHKFDEFVARATVATPLLGMVRTTSQQAITDYIPKLEITGRVSHRSTDGEALAIANRTQPTTSEVPITTTEFKAELDLTDGVLRQNVMKERLAGLLEQQMPIRIGRDIQQNLVSGATGSAVFDLAAFDGIRARAVTNIVNAASAPLDFSHLKECFQTMPEEFRGDKTKLMWMCADDLELEYREDLAARMGALGDAMLQRYDALNQLAVPFQPIPEWPVNLGGGTDETDILLIDPKGFVVSFWQTVTMERERDVRAGKNIWVWSYQVGCNYEEEEAVVKIQNVQVA